MLSGSAIDAKRRVGVLRCRYKDFFYTPRHAEILHLRRKESIQLTARFAAVFMCVLLAVVPFWDGAYDSQMWLSQTSIMRLLVVGIAIMVLVNRAVSARWRRHFPYLPMLMLVIAACLLCGFGAHDLLATQRMFSAHSFLLLGLVLMIAIMPLTLVEAAILSSPIMVLLVIGAQASLATGFVALEMILAVLLPLAILSSLVQLYRTIVAAQEVAIDPLTGCFTRAFGMEMIRVTFDSSMRKNAPYTMAFIDLDDFKQINDRHGHDYGDRILAEVGNNLVDRFRSSDLVVRWGGEEFLVLLPELPMAQANEVLARVMAPGLASLQGGQTQCASVGLSERIEDAISIPQNLIDLADQRMYDAKKRRDHDDMIAESMSGRKRPADAAAIAATAHKSSRVDSKTANQTIN